MVDHKCLKLTISNYYLLFVGREKLIHIWFIIIISVDWQNVFEYLSLQVCDSHSIFLPNYHFLLIPIPTPCPLHFKWYQAPWAVPLSCALELCPWAVPLSCAHTEYIISLTQDKLWVINSIISIIIVVIIFTMIWVWVNSPASQHSDTLWEKDMLLQ